MKKVGVAVEVAYNSVDLMVKFLSKKKRLVEIDVGIGVSMV